MEETAGSVYSEAKGEYTKQLTLFLVPVFHRFFMESLHQASQEEPLVKRQLWKFQELLSQIPEWNIDKVQRETGKLIGNIQCDYLEELVTAVFIAHTKVLTAIRIGNKNKRVQITIPKLDHFVHRALSECARLLWSSAYLFHNEQSSIDKQKNHRQIEQLLHEGVGQAIRGLLPVKNILKDYLSGPDHEDSGDAGDAGDAGDETDIDEKEEKEGKEVKGGSKEAKKEIIEKLNLVVDSLDDENIVVSNQEQIPEVIPIPLIPTEELKIKDSSKIMEEIPNEVVTSTPASASTPAPTRFVIDTAPIVQFTDYNQVIQESGNNTQISYEHTDHEPSIDEEVKFLDSHGEPLSDFEDILEEKGELLDTNDFEIL